MLAANLLSQGCLFFASLYLARVLGPESFGRISFAAAFAAYFVLFTDCGLTLYGIREISCNSEGVKAVVKSVLCERVILAFLAFCLLIGIIVFVNKSQEIKLLIMLYGLGTFSSALLIEWVFQGLEKFHIVAFGRLATGVLYLLLVIIYVQNPSQEMIPPLAWVGAGGFVAIIVGSIFFREYGSPIACRISNGLLTLTKKNFPMGLSLIMIQVVYTIDSVMLGFLGNDADVGVYAAIYKIILALILVGAVYFEAVFPLMSRLCMSSRSSFCDLQRLNLKLVSAFIAPVFFVSMICGEILIPLMFGKAYLKGLPAYYILIFSVVLIYYNMLFARGLWAYNKQNIFLKIVILQSVLNVIINFILIPKYNMIGAAISTMIAELIGLILYYICLNKMICIEIEKVNLVPFLLIVVMSTANKMFSNVIMILPMAVTYIMILCIIKYISRSEMILFEY